MIFETHAHYDDDRFEEDRDVTIQRVCDSGVAPIINTAYLNKLHKNNDGACRKI